MKTLSPDEIECLLGVRHPRLTLSISLATATARKVRGSFAPNAPISCRKLWVISGAL